MRGTKQGGSVLNFIIVAVVLVGLVVGGIYILRQQMGLPQEESLPEEQPVVVEETQPEPIEEEVQPVESVQELPGVETEQLPQTGPAESMAMALALGLLSLAAVSYVQSRRAVSSL